MKKYKELFIALLAFLLYFLFSPIIKYIFELLNIDLKNMNYILLNIILVILFLIYRKDIINDFKNFINNKGKWFIKYIGIFLLSILLMGILNVILYKITNMEITKNEETVRELIKIYPIYMFFSTVFYAPFIEELLFRKAIRKVIKGNDKYTKIVYILVSSIIFGILHVLTIDASFYDLLMGIPYMVAGLSFGYIYAKTDNVFSCIQFHLMHNLTLIIINLILRGWYEKKRRNRRRKEKS